MKIFIFIIFLLFIFKIYSFGIEHIPKEINKFINNDTTKSNSLKRIKSNIFRIQVYDSIMCGYFAYNLLIIRLKVRHY